MNGKLENSYTSAPMCTRAFAAVHGKLSESYEDDAEKLLGVLDIFFSQLDNDSSFIRTIHSRWYWRMQSIGPKFVHIIV